MENKVKEAEKLSYEDLKSLASTQQAQISELIRERSKIYAENQQLMEVAMGKRMESMFRVLDHKELFRKEFIKDVVNNIEGMLTPPEEGDKAEE